jgi:hypothetical protein
MRQFAEELVRLKLSHADPLGSGHVASLGHPGGNATGLTIMMT